MVPLPPCFSEDCITFCDFLLFPLIFFMLSCLISDCASWTWRQKPKVSSFQIYSQTNVCRLRWPKSLVSSSSLGLFSRLTKTEIFCVVAEESVLSGCGANSWSWTQEDSWSPVLCLCTPEPEELGGPKKPSRSRRAGESNLWMKWNQILSLQTKNWIIS